MDPKIDFVQMAVRAGAERQGIGVVGIDLEGRAQIGRWRRYIFPFGQRRSRDPPAARPAAALPAAPSCSAAVCAA